MARILLVEDDEALASSIIEVLSEKYELTHAADVTSAKRTLISGKFDLMLLDVTLPDGSGIDFYGTLLSENLINIPLIFLTGQSDLDSRMKGLALGAQDYILKPFVAAHLLQKIRKIIQTKSQFSLQLKSEK